MLFQFIWILSSLFAVIGITVCILEGVKAYSFSKSHCVETLTVQVRLSGNEPRTEYLINSLLVLCDQLEVNHISPKLELLDGGVTDATRRMILEDCEKNPRVLFTEESKNDIII